jgi:hypothetical protein
MEEIATAKKYKIVNVPSDGDCAVHALIDQLQHQQGVVVDVETVRKNAVQYLRSHPELVSDSFLVQHEDIDHLDHLTKQSRSGQ